MADKTPDLSSRFQTFDWDDHPDSRDALISDGPTTDFDNETWNAIVSLLAEALDDSGIGWDNRYTTASEAKLDPYENLSAKIFNSVRYNINRVVPIHFDWATDPNFRGYVGREDFRGYDTYGENSDDVYPEYIFELVYRLNQFIEILKGNMAAVLEFGEGIISESTSDVYLREGTPFTLAGSEYCSASDSWADIDTGYGARLRLDEFMSESDYIMHLRVPKGLRLVEYKQIIRSKNNVILRRGEGKRVVKFAMISRSNNEVKIRANRMANIALADPRIRSSNIFNLHTGKSVVLSIDATKIGTDYLIDMHMLRSAPIQLADNIQRSTAEFALRTPKSLRIDKKYIARAKHYFGGIRTGTGVRLRKQVYSGTKVSGGIRTGTGVNVGGNHIGRSRSSNEGFLAVPMLEINATGESKSSLTYEPVNAPAAHIRANAIGNSNSTQLDLELVPSDPIYIRAHSVGKSELGVDFVPPIPISIQSISKENSQINIDMPGSDSMGAQINVLSKSNTRLGTAWYPPEWTDKGLYIKQMYDRPMIAKGLIDVAARSISKVNSNGNVVIGWMMPVETDKGLYIRQINGELEVM